MKKLAFQVVFESFLNRCLAAVQVGARASEQSAHQSIEPRPEATAAGPHTERLEPRGVEHVQQRGACPAQEPEEASAQGANAGGERPQQLE